MMKFNNFQDFTVSSHLFQPKETAYLMGCCSSAWIHLFPLSSSCTATPRGKRQDDKEKDGRWRAEQLSDLINSNHRHSPWIPPSQARLDVQPSAIPFNCCIDWAVLVGVRPFDCIEDVCECESWWYSPLNRINCLIFKRINWAIIITRHTELYMWTWMKDNSSWMSSCCN